MAVTLAAQLTRLRWGQRIREQRLYKGVPQEEFARSVGVTQQTVSSWETGRYAPQPELWYAIAAALATSWWVLFDPEPRPGEVSG